MNLVNAVRSMARASDPVWRFRKQTSWNCGITCPFADDLKQGITMESVHLLDSRISI